jgi:hypothetical protein
VQIKLVKNVTTQAVVDKMNGMTSVQIEEEQVLSVPIAIDNPPEGITAHMKLQLKDKEYPEQSDNTNNTTQEQEVILPLCRKCENCLRRSTTQETYSFNEE